jgi:hypothetical protein
MLILMKNWILHLMCPDYDFLIVIPLFDFVTARSVVSVRFGLFSSSCSHVQPDLELAAIFLLLTAQWGGVCFLVDFCSTSPCSASPE